jgi:hypothetical protein
MPATWVPTGLRRRPGAALGVVICQLVGQRLAAAILFFDAYDLARGPIARLPLRSPVPPLFRASRQRGLTQRGE